MFIYWNERKTLPFCHFLDASLSITGAGVGVGVGVPLAVTGAVIGSVGGLTVSGGIIREKVVQNKQLQSASKHLQADYFHSMQLRILFGRAASSHDFAKKLLFKLLVQPVR